MMHHIRTLLTSLGATALVISCTAHTQTDIEPETPTSSNTPDLVIHDSVAPYLEQWRPEPTILVFRKTQAYRHDASIAAGDRFFADLAEERQFGIFTTENGAVFNADDLKRFKLIVFNNMSGDTLTPEQEDAFKTWLENGGAWIGLHSSGDFSHTDWSWYDKTLIGPEFTGHPSAQYHLQDARVAVLDDTHPVVKGLPESWIMRDEWYSFDGVPQDYGLTPLVGLDETTYKPLNPVNPGISDLSMGDAPLDHPVVWSSCVGEGRAVYSAIGHVMQVYDNTNYQQLLNNAFDWTLKAGPDVDKGC